MHNLHICSTSIDLEILHRYSYTSARHSNRWCKHFIYSWSPRNDLYDVYILRDLKENDIIYLHLRGVYKFKVDDTITFSSELEKLLGL